MHEAKNKSVRGLNDCLILTVRPQTFPLYYKSEFIPPVSAMYYRKLFSGVRAQGVAIKIASDKTKTTIYKKI